MLVLIVCRFEIAGYPTLKFFPAGSADGEPYDGQREVEAMVDFINSRAGTLRNSDGSLKPSAGRVAALDEIIVAAQHNVDAVLVNSIKLMASGLEGKDSVFAKLYVNAAEKILAKGAQFIISERDRLTKMINGSNVKPDAKTNFLLRRNVLAAFDVSAREEL